MEELKNTNPNEKNEVKKSLLRKLNPQMKKRVFQRNLLTAGQRLKRSSGLIVRQ